MKRIWMLLSITGMLAALNGARAALPHINAELTYAPNVPPPITRQEPAIVEVDLTATQKKMPLSSSANYTFWTFNGHTPGPFIRVRQGDWLEVHMDNTDSCGLPHNVDFHAATAPGGGAMFLTVAPGQKQTAWLRMVKPGLFVYHCAMTPMLDHIANGMYGLILVEPTNGLPHVDHEYYVMQGEFYTSNSPASDGVLPYSQTAAMQGRPSFVVFNGQSGSMLLTDALQAKTGESIRIFFGNAGPNFASAFHIIGTTMDNVFEGGSLANPPLHDLQTTLVPPGSASIMEFTPVVPGYYTFMDHSAAHCELGAMGQIEVTGPAMADLCRTAQDGPPSE